MRSSAESYYESNNVARKKLSRNAAMREIYVGYKP
jgi:hypothetical protein